MLNGYFGVGFTLYLNPFKNENSRIFCQATIGLTTDYPNVASEDINTQHANNLVYYDNYGSLRLKPVFSLPGMRGFYLVKVHFNQALGKKAQIVIGTEIRGIFPDFPPVYAAFAGLRLDLNIIQQLLSSK